MKFKLFSKSGKSAPSTDRKEIMVTRFSFGYNELFGEVRTLINNDYLIVTKVEYAKSPENPLLGFKGNPMLVAGRPITPWEKSFEEVQGKDITDKNRWNYELDGNDLRPFYQGEVENLALSFSDEHYRSYFTREFWYNALSNGFRSNENKSFGHGTAATQQQPLISSAD